jgi:DSF synthase
MGALDFHFALAQPVVSDRIAAKLERGASNVLWATMAKAAAGECQNFSLPLLHGLSELLDVVRDNASHWYCDGELAPVNYMVLRSAHPDYFSLGGDLRHFRSCIERKDRDGLLQYSKLCLDMLYAWATSLNKQTTTIALGSGQGIGRGIRSGVERGLSGGMSLLARRVGVYEAERMMTDGRIYSAAELKEKGIIDEICPRGDGTLAVHKFIANHEKHRNARLSLQRARHRMAPLDYRELLTVVEEWVDAGMNLADPDLKVMDMLIRLQRNTQSPASH